MQRPLVQSPLARALLLFSPDIKPSLGDFGNTITGL